MSDEIKNHTDEQFLALVKNGFRDKEQLVPEFTELETKYRVEPGLLDEFKTIAENLSGLNKFIYCEGPDHYFTRPDNSFIRYRRATHGMDAGRAELTIKVKPEGAKNNIFRKEVNLRIDANSENTVREAILLMGYTTNFSIKKWCHIYTFEDATLVFYSVSDITDGNASKADSYIEIEISEEKVHTMTESQAWDIIVKYEGILSPLGITARNRLKRSLFEMYKRDKNEGN